MYIYIIMCIYIYTYIQYTHHYTSVCTSMITDDPYFSEVGSSI